ncbi:unnamed protein product [Adineta steineri]|uniref:G-protein coupled receptors family 1 profile domain-containing protein n=2 Tax=Adineta steineri TaxID=433720 RepID=A0A814Q740_9BILA|nr:unnamed protein product [Adineta steineri]
MSYLNTINSIFNLISIFLDMIAFIICLSFLSIIAYHFIQRNHHHNQIINNVPLILSINTLCIIIMKSIFQTIHITIPTIMKDFHNIAQIEETFVCRLKAYILWSIVGQLYWSYVLLAFFRFVRIIYPKQLWLCRSFFYLYILIPCQFIFVFLGILPSFLVFDCIHLILNEAFCDILIKPAYFCVYSNTIAFGIPYTILCIFYIKIGQKMRQPSMIRLHQERNRRDYIVIKRMLLNSILLCLIAVPYVVLYIISIFYEYLNSTTLRFQWLSSSFGSFLFSLFLPLITTQLGNLLKSNKIIPRNDQTERRD